MGLPVAVGSGVIGTVAIDAASYVWTVWKPIVNQGQNPETWRIQVDIATAAYPNLIVSANSAGTTPLCTAALNAAGALTVNALYAFDHGVRNQNDSGATLYYNYQWSATTTMKLFWVSASGAEASI